MLYDNQIDFVTPPGYDSFTHFLNVTDVFLWITHNECASYGFNSKYLKYYI